MFSVWGSADGTSWPGAHRDHLLHWGAAVSLQCPLWRGQSCGEDILGRGLGWRTVPVPVAQERWFSVVQAVRLTGPHLFLCPCIDSSLAWAPLSWPASALGKVNS